MTRKLAKKEVSISDGKGASISAKTAIKNTSLETLAVLALTTGIALITTQLEAGAALMITGVFLLYIKYSIR